MSEYQDSARNCHVLKDSITVHAATECNKLAEENRRMARKLNGLRRTISLVVLEVIKIDNQLNPKVKSDK